MQVSHKCKCHTKVQVLHKGDVCHRKVTCVTDYASVTGDATVTKVQVLHKGGVHVLQACV